MPLSGRIIPDGENEEKTGKPPGIQMS